mgnify:CR=1 FL=1
MSYGTSDASNINDIGGNVNTNQSAPLQQPYNQPTLTIEDIQKSRNNELTGIGNGGTNAPNASVPGQSNVVPQDIINKMIPDIQNAAMDGSLKLPSRDIPQQPTQFTNDPAVQQNQHVKFTENNTKYIYDNAPVRVPMKRDGIQQDANIWFDELFVPVLAGVLFYIFSSTGGLEMIQKVIPSIFKSDGTMKSNGLMVLSICFVASLYGCINMHSYFTK